MFVVILPTVRDYCRLPTPSVKLKTRRPSDNISLYFSLAASSEIIFQKYAFCELNEFPDGTQLALWCFNVGHRMAGYKILGSLSSDVFE